MSVTSRPGVPRRPARAKPGEQHRGARRRSNLKGHSYLRAITAESILHEDNYSPVSDAVVSPADSSTEIPGELHVLPECNGASDCASSARLESNSSASKLAHNSPTRPPAAPLLACKWLSCTTVWMSRFGVVERSIHMAARGHCRGRHMHGCKRAWQRSVPHSRKEPSAKICGDREILEEQNIPRGR